MMSFVQKTLVDSDYHEFVNHKTRENDVAFVSFDPIGLLSTNHIVILQGHTVHYRKWSATANDPETASDPQSWPQMIPKEK